MNYELEFDITNLLRELLTPHFNDSTPAATATGTTATGTTATGTTATGTTATGTTATGTTATSRTTVSDISGVPDAFLTMMQHNQNIIDELVYSYNIQMQRYNSNIERLIQLLQSSQTRIHQYIMSLSSPTTANPSSTYTHIPLYSPFRRNAIREDGNRIRSMLNYPSYNTSASTLLYAYLYPRADRNTISSEQRESAIQTVPYNSDSMRENVCPISLLSFTQGEQVSQIKHCRHVFKTDSLNHWLTNYSTCCPVCRYDIRTYRESGSAPTSTPNTTNRAYDYESDSEETDEE